MFKDHEKLTLVYSAKASDESVTIKCHKLKVSPTITYVQIAKLCIVEKGSTVAVEGKIRDFDYENLSGTFVLENAIDLDQSVFTKEIKIEYPKKFIQIPVYNQ